MSELATLKGVGPATIEKLEAAGISTLMAVAVSSPTEIAEVSGLSEAASRKITQQAREGLDLGFQKAAEYVKKKDIFRVDTGCKGFDEMLGGGFESRSLSELFGQFSCGKSQISHLMTVRAIKDDKKAKAIFLDTESTFRADRLQAFAKECGLDPEDVMQRVFVTRANNSDHQILLIDELERMLQKDDTYKLLVIDSLTGHFRSEFIGRGTLASRQQMLNKHMHKIARLADLYNLVVILTNQVMSRPNVMYGDPIVPIGGHIVAHNSTFRVYLRPGKKGTLHATLVDSPNLPKGECDFQITEGGIEDV